MKILIVDDDRFYRKIYKHKFELLKYEVELAENGKIALDITRNFRPDIILLDIMMPVMDGFDTLLALKKDPEIKSIPVLMLTNLSTGKDINQAVTMGAVDCLVKSDLTPDQIVEKVEKILQV